MLTQSARPVRMYEHGDGDVLRYGDQDGKWRDEAFGFERAFLFFDNSTIDAARGTWRMLGERDGVERHFWKQEGGRWVEGP